MPCIISVPAARLSGLALRLFRLAVRLYIRAGRLQFLYLVRHDGVFRCGQKQTGCLTASGTHEKNNNY